MTAPPLTKISFTSAVPIVLIRVDLHEPSPSNLGPMTARPEFSPEQIYICDLVHPRRVPQGPKPNSLPRTFIFENKLGRAVASVINEFDEGRPASITSPRFETELVNVADSLKTNGINYAVIKSLFPITKQIGDIDILVDDISQAGSILESNGFAKEGRQPYKHKYSKEDTSSRLVVHLHKEVAWHGQVYLDKELVLGETVTHDLPAGEVLGPCPTHEALIIAAHMLFEKGNNRIILLDVLTFWEWFQNDNLDLDEMRRLSADYGWEFGLQCYLAGTSDVYRRAYDEPFSSTGTLAEMVEFPVPFDSTFETFLINFGQMYAVRESRIAWVFNNSGLYETLHCIQTYIRDFIVEFRNRYGFTYTVKRLRQ